MGLLSLTGSYTKCCPALDGISYAILIKKCYWPYEPDLQNSFILNVKWNLNSATRHLQKNQTWPNVDAAFHSTLYRFFIPVLLIDCLVKIKVWIKMLSPISKSPVVTKQRGCFFFWGGGLSSIIIGMFFLCKLTYINQNTRHRHSMIRITFPDEEKIMMLFSSSNC